MAREAHIMGIDEGNVLLGPPWPRTPFQAPVLYTVTLTAPACITAHL